MFKSKNKFSYSTRGRTIEQNNSGKKLTLKASNSKSISAKKNLGVARKSK